MRKSSFFCGRGKSGFVLVYVWEEMGDWIRVKVFYRTVLILRVMFVHKLEQKKGDFRLKSNLFL